MHHGGKRVLRLHLHPDGIDGDAAGDDVRRVAINQTRIVCLAVRDDQQPVGTIAKLFFPGFQQGIGTLLHVFTKRGSSLRGDAVDRPVEPFIIPRAKRVNPVAVREHEHAHVSGAGNLP